jgi:hypothetical protein
MYTTGSLTYGSDKLIAISALARHTQNLMGDGVTYLAGLWSPYLASQLLWHSPGFFDLNSRSAKYRAPTWSWASVDGPVLYPCVVYRPDEKDILIKVEDAKVDLLSNDHPFGPVKGGYIEVSGHLARVSVHSKKDPEIICPAYNLKVYVDYKSSLRGIDLSPRGSTTVHKDSSFENGEPVLGSYEDLYFLPIRSIRYEGEPSITGIILEAVWGREGTFQRFGRYTMDVREDGDLFKSGFKHFDYWARQSGLKYHQDGKKGNVYTITII